MEDLQNWSCDPLEIRQQSKDRGTKIAADHSWGDLHSEWGDDSIYHNLDCRHSVVCCTALPRNELSRYLNSWPLPAWQDVPDSYRPQGLHVAGNLDDTDLVVLLSKLLTTPP